MFVCDRALVLLDLNPNRQEFPDIYHELARNGCCGVVRLNAVDPVVDNAEEQITRQLMNEEYAPLLLMEDAFTPSDHHRNRIVFIKGKQLNVCSLKAAMDAGYLICVLQLASHHSGFSEKAFHPSLRLPTPSYRLRHKEDEISSDWILAAAYYHPTATRRDLCDRFTAEQCMLRGGNGQIHASQFLCDFAVKLEGQRRKYGA